MGASCFALLCFGRGCVLGVGVMTNDLVKRRTALDSTFLSRAGGRPGYVSRYDNDKGGCIYVIGDWEFGIKAAQS